MNQANTSTLMNRFGQWFNTEDLQVSLMAFGFECGDGWYSLLSNLFVKIEKVLQENKVPLDKFEVVQVKEKFGGLRVYYQFRGSETGDKGWEDNISIVDDKIHDLISQAEDTAEETCEITGKPGKNRNINGWYSTLCDEEYNKLMKKKGQKG